MIHFESTFESVLESALFAIVIFYAFLFLVKPAPGLLRSARGGTGSLRPTPAEVQPSPSAVLIEEPVPALPPQETALPAVEAPPAFTHVETSWLVRLRTGLQKTRAQLFRGLDELFLSKETKIKRDEVLERIFELLIRSDVGVKTTEQLVAAARTKLAASELADLEETKKILASEMLAIFEQANAKPSPVASGVGFAEPHVVMVVGVNGVGKTTTTGKLAKRLSDRGAKVVIGAADTFRAAAVEQLRVWAERAHSEFVTFKEGSDPASVAFEAVKRAAEMYGALNGSNSLGSGNASGDPKPVVCLVDTAGRLHNRKDLMEELSKVKRVLGKFIASSAQPPPHEVILVVDATTGQNAISQARTFMEVVDVSGLILTKLDGTAKGGVALAIAGDLGLPILYVGVGESVEDLQPFDPREFIDALFGA